MSTDWDLMAKLVNSIFTKPEAEPFREPVDWKALGLFDYPQLIKDPKDLGEVKRKIEKNQYESLHDAADDVRLVWKNCMTYNADGSDFYILAQSMSKKFEDRFAKLVKELDLGDRSVKGAAGAGPTLEEKRTFAKSLYRIGKEELGKVITDLDAKCPAALTKNAAEDEVEINVDQISASAFKDVMAYVSSCGGGDGNGRKKKSASSAVKNKKARTS